MPVSTRICIANLRRQIYAVLGIDSYSHPYYQIVQPHQLCLCIQLIGFSIDRQMAIVCPLYPLAPPCSSIICSESDKGLSGYRYAQTAAAFRLFILNIDSGPTIQRHSSPPRRYYLKLKHLRHSLKERESALDHQLLNTLRRSSTSKCLLANDACHYTVMGIICGLLSDSLSSR